MPLKKLWRYTQAGFAVCLAAGTLGGYLSRFGLRETGGAIPNDLSLAASFHTSEAPASDFLPVQSRNPDNLGLGKLLVASRNLRDPLFAKTVILIVRYDAQGVLGLIVNRRTRVPLSRALENLTVAKDRSDLIYAGGPVQMPAVFALYKPTAELEGAEHIFDGVYLITAKSLFEKTISAHPDPGIFHVYLGYAGWSPAQLRQEVELGAWFIFPAEAGAIFNADPDSLWLEMIRKTEMQFARRDAHDRIGICPAN